MTTETNTLQASEELNEHDLIADLIFRGFVTEEQIEAAQALRQREARQDIYHPLSHYLVETQALTKAQMERLLDEHQHTNRIDELPNYKLIKQIGHGSMGVVYLAEQKNLQRQVALKVLSRRLMRNRHYIESFIREARQAANTHSPYWPHVYDLGRAHGQQFMAMEYIDGVSVQVLLSEEKPFGEIATLQIAAEVCMGLDHIHGMSIIHRDMKPHNILLEKNGQLRLIDLGLCLPTGDENLQDLERGAAIGTPLYISPEQAASRREIGPPSDLYGLGATMYHMLVGRPPFEPRKGDDIFEAHLNEPPVPPKEIRQDLSDGVNELVLKLLAKEPNERPPTALALREEILRLIAPQECSPAIICRVLHARLDELGLSEQEAEEKTQQAEDT